jgi:hypothetical protein
MILSVFVRYLQNSLVAYGVSGNAIASNSEQLVEDFGLADSNAIRAPLVATLAVSYEPLTVHELLTLLAMRGLVTDGSEGTVLIRNGLSALASMLHHKPDRNGKEGYTLFHKSFQDHVLTTGRMARNIKLTKLAFAQAAIEPDRFPATSNYFYRWGIDHLIETDNLTEARAKLLDLNHIQRICELTEKGMMSFKIWPYWGRIDNDSTCRPLDGGGLTVSLGESVSADYLATVKRLDDTSHVSEKELESLRNVLSDILLSGYHTDIFLEVAKVSRGLHDRVLGHDHPSTFYSVVQLGRALFDSGKVEGARMLLQENLENCERIFGFEHSDSLSCAWALAQISPTEEKKLLECRVKEVAERVEGPQSFYLLCMEIADELDQSDVQEN